MLKDVLFPSRSLDVSQSLWQEIFWIPGLCSQTLETDALRLHWELCSGRGLICGDSLGKQFHLLAFYWKLLYRLLHVNKLYSLQRGATSISDGIFFNCAKAGCAHSGGEKKRVIVIFLTFDRALLQNSPCTIVIGRISSRNTFFKNCLALNCFAGQSVYHRTFYFWCQVLTKETNNILFL